MDEITAKLYEDRFKGTQIDEWQISKLLDSGKSAAVFLGHSNGRDYAIKVFDLETVKRHGYEVQQHRLENELSLRGHGIAGLVAILGGGQHERDGVTYFYIAMPFLEGINLRKYIASAKYDQSFAAKVLNTLLDVSEKLLERNIAHRDIKPDNIMVSKNGDITLMDLGVLKIVGSNPSFSDTDEKQFLGTLRYASPEFLFGIEQNTLDGWRSLNIYQIGATLHDLIMKQELFHGIAPYANVVMAVKETSPTIENKDIDQRLIALTRNMLSKNWQKRLAMSPPEKIREILQSLSTPLAGASVYYQKAMAIQNTVKTWADEVTSLSSSIVEKNRQLDAIDMELSQKITDSMGRVKRIINFRQFNVLGEAALEKGKLGPFEVHKNRLYRFDGDIQNGFLRSFFIIVSYQFDFERNCVIQLSAILPGRFVQLDYLRPDTSPLPLAWSSLWEQITKQMYPGRSLETVPRHMFHFIVAFEGILAFDQAFAESLDAGFSRILARILEVWQPRVQSDMQEKRGILLGEVQHAVSAFADNTIFVPSSSGEII